MFIDIHHPSLRAALAAIAAEIRVLEQLLRARFIRSMADEQRALAYHQRIVERLGPSYTVTLSESA
jgi:hypothetical protein